MYIGRSRKVEIATFRGISDKPKAHHKDYSSNNVFGTMDEDAWRRDFSVNALYYDLRNQEVIDYTGGVRDLRRIGLHWA